MLLAVDFGSKKVGIAISDEGEKFAVPFSILKNDNNLLEEVLKIVKDYSITLVVVGKSVNLFGIPNEIQKDAEAFADRLRASGIEVEFFDERFTTAQAKEIQNINKKPNSRSKQATKPLDDKAATIILQDFLDSRQK